MPRPQIKQFKPTEWPLLSARLIQDRINSVLLEHGQCTVVLTGGRSAERLYTSWARLPEFSQTSGIRFYFGDERCVLPDHLESNYAMVMRSLFNRGVPVGCSVFRMEAEDSDREAAAQRYAEVLPEKVDVLLLGVGEDGHIASLFPGSPALLEVSRRVLAASGPKPPYERLTITPTVIAQARSVFVLAAGAAKANVLAGALNGESGIVTLPARLVIGANWLMDTAIQDDKAGG